MSFRSTSDKISRVDDDDKNENYQLHDHAFLFTVFVFGKTLYNGPLWSYEGYRKKEECRKTIDMIHVS